MNWLPELHEDITHFFEQLKTVNGGTYEFHYLPGCLCNACLQLEKMNKKLHFFSAIEKNVSEVTLGLLVSGEFEQIEIKLKLKEDKSK